MSTVSEAMDVKARRQNPRIVQHHAVAAMEIRRQITEQAIFPLSIRPMQNQHSGSIALSERLLRDEFFGEGIVELRQEHLSSDYRGQFLIAAGKAMMLDSCRPFYSSLATSISTYWINCCAVALFRACGFWTQAAGPAEISPIFLGQDTRYSPRTPTQELSKRLAGSLHRWQANLRPKIFRWEQGEALVYPGGVASR